MLTLTGSNILVIVIAVILVIFVVGIFLYLSNKLRARRNQLLNELSNKPALIQDRAFNRLAMARREAQVLARTGTDITRAQERIAESQAAFDLHQYPRSYELAQSAHESLVNARSRPPSAPATPSDSAARPAPVARPTPLVSGPSNGSPAAVPPAAPPLAKNRAESHFQIGLLESDLSSSKSRTPNAGTTQEADALCGQAQAAFDRAEYSDAFRLALRGRRALGSVEALGAPAKGTPLSASASSEDPAGDAERMAGADRCPECGYPTTAEDVFCRGCGVSRTSNTCPSCGAPRGSSDTFCGKCGARFTN